MLREDNRRLRYVNRHHKHRDLPNDEYLDIWTGFCFCLPESMMGVAM